MIKANKGHNEQLKAVGEGDGSVANIAYVALLLASLDRPGVGFQKYEHHLKILALDMAGEKVSSDSAVDRANILATVMHQRHEYTGNVEYYEDLQNGNLMSVIDTGKGLPVSLGILYMHAARSQGWQVEGLYFPNHFLLRLHGAESNAPDQVIIDPFYDGRILDAPNLRKLIQKFSGDRAELRPDFYAAIADRDILVRMLETIKIRCLKVSDLGQAINILSRLVMIDPQQMQHHYELGMLLAHVGKNDFARKSLLHCLYNIEKLCHDELIEQQIINSLRDLDRQELEKDTSNVVKLTEIE